MHNESRQEMFRPQRVADLVNAACAGGIPVLSALPVSVSAATAPLIAAHDGAFHCDEVLACGMLRVLPQFRNSPIIRTRDARVLEQCQVVVDVGAVHDEAGLDRLAGVEEQPLPRRLLLDHHQASFKDTFSPQHAVTKLSSAGLVYRLFGRSVISAVVERRLSVKEVDVLFDKTYTSFVEHIDAIDNGVQISGPGGPPPLYDVSTSLSARVGNLNLPWNAPEAALPPDELRKIENALFAEAMRLTLTEFLECIVRLSESFLPARDLVESALDQAIDEGHPEYIVFDHRCSWKDHLVDVEQERADMEGRVLYVLFKDSSSSWRVQAVPAAKTGFGDRKSLPAAWRGLRDDALSQLTGIPGCIFCHATGFIAGNQSREGAIAMALLAIQA